MEEEKVEEEMLVLCVEIFAPSHHLRVAKEHCVGLADA